MSKVDWRIGKAKQALMAGVGIIVMACTSARESSEYNAAVPSTIRSDADRRAIYNSADDRPIPRQPSLNNQASEINRKKNIENWHENNPQNKPIEVRTRIANPPPADTLP